MIAAFSRLVPHPPNLAPVGGLALFSGAHLKGKIAYGLPLLIMLISDLFLGFHSTIPYVYLSFLLIVFIGRRLQKKKTFIRIITISFTSSVLFFLITNFGVWISTNMYAKNFAGLVNAYDMGLPFFRNTLIGDMFYTLVFFYGYEYISLLMKNFLLAKQRVNEK